MVRDFNHSKNYCIAASQPHPLPSNLTVHNHQLLNKVYTLYSRLASGGLILHSYISYDRHCCKVKTMHHLCLLLSISNATLHTAWCIVHGMWHVHSACAWVCVWHKVCLGH